MKILACGVVHNEIDVLPYLLEYYKTQGVDVFIFDNISNDGTWEYLLDNGVECERLESDGGFDLVHFIEKREEKWKEAKPDWCIFLDADEFPLTFQFTSLNEMIENRDKQGFNVIKQTRVNFRPTGSEDFKKGNPRKIYRYYFINFPEGKGHPQCERIFKYCDDINVVRGAGHTVYGFDKKVSIEPLDNPIFHYSMRENAKEKTHERFNRRSKDENAPKRWNTHYKKYIEKDKWLWAPDELNDIKNPKDPLCKILNARDEFHPYGNIDPFKAPEIADKILNEYLDIVESLGIKTFLMYGTCLGFVRDGGYIEGDNDIDVGILEGIEEITVALVGNGFIRARQCKWSRHFLKYGMLLDVVHIIPDKKFMQFFDVLTYNGRFINMPHPAKKYLEERFGDWRTPRRRETWEER